MHQSIFPDKRKIICIGGGSFIGLIFIFLLSFLMQPQPGWYQLDVGEADAALVIGDHGSRILFDTGDGTLIRQRLDTILPPWDRHIDIVVLTHTDADHAGGLMPLVSTNSIGKLLWTGIDVPRTDIKGAISILEGDSKTAIVPIDIRSLDVDGWHFLFLWPEKDLRGFKSAQANATSIVTYAYFHGMAIITSGDATIQTEQEIHHRHDKALSDHAPVNVMKIGHHGSLTSTSPAWLTSWNPNCISISVGKKNTFGHPHPLILARIQSILPDHPIQRTDTEMSFWYHVVDREVVVDALSLSHHRVFDRIKDTISSILSSWRPTYGNRTNINHPQTRCGPAQARWSDSSRI